MRVRFQCYPAKRIVRFYCPSCGKNNRTRTFSAECTVNPFNKADGIPLNGAQVAQQSKEKVSSAVQKFLTEPLCSRCENELSWGERKSLRERRSCNVEARK